MARTSRERLPKNAHISAFLVPADAEGIEVGKIEKKMGQSGAWISAVIFKNVRVPATSIIGGIEGRGCATARQSLDPGRQTADRQSEVVEQRESARDEIGG